MGTLINEQTKSQNAVILRHLLTGKPINPLEALNKYGCFRLGARIYDLKQNGHQIESEMIRDSKTGKCYAQYSMR